MVDTNVFSRIVDGRLRRASIPLGAEFVVTPIQVSELQATASAKRIAELANEFGSWDPDTIPAESAWWDTMKWGTFRWGDDSCAPAIKADLDALRVHKNNAKDAQIIEAALKNGLPLLSCEGKVCVVAEKWGVKAIRL